MMTSTIPSPNASRKSAKPRMLVVDDEPDNLDLLYRTFRREFRVLKAASGREALEILSDEGEVAVIISDQRMPEMKGTEFLSKTVPQFPDTVRIILTGFTDVEDLVDAINAGQVYRYITKPWDPEELKQVVNRATEAYDLLKQRTYELKRAHTQTALFSTITSLVQTVDSLEGSLAPIAKAFESAFEAAGGAVQLVESGSLAGTPGVSGDLVNADWLAQDPLVARAIAEQQLQVLDNTTGLPEDQADRYQRQEIESHVALPILYRDRVIAVVSIQWHTPLAAFESGEEVLALAAGQLALALVCLGHS
jgi:CheY-like chemotaxis protein